MPPPRPHPKKKKEKRNYQLHRTNEILQGKGEMKKHIHSFRKNLFDELLENELGLVLSQVGASFF